jgi:hypothetical protein
MLGLASSSQSPFISVWYLFLAFLGVVLLVHIIGLIVSTILRRYAERLYDNNLERRKP